MTSTVMMDLTCLQFSVQPFGLTLTLQKQAAEIMVFVEFVI